MSLINLNFDEAQLAIYLDRGLEFQWSKKRIHTECLNAFFSGEGDLERTQEIIYLAKKMYAEIPDGCDVPWSTICYLVIETQLAQRICKFPERLTDEEIISQFKELLKTQIIAFNH